MLKIQLHTDELSVFYSHPNISYSPVSYLKVKYVVKVCGDIHISHYFFPKCFEPFQSVDLGLFQVAKFFSIYPFHCFCSYGSDFSLKNMYNFYNQTCYTLPHHFLFGLFSRVLGEHLTFVLYITVSFLQGSFCSLHPWMQISISLLNFVFPEMLLLIPLASF